MRQVLYIEADEEMISVISRLRKSPSPENVIVAPLRSLILQSIVNLRLLAHDARKNGKEIIVVTQDEQSRSLCEKVGIRTQAALDEDDRHSADTAYSGTAPLSETLRPHRERESEADDSDDETSGHGVNLPHSDSIGSSDFFGSAALPPRPQEYRSPEMPHAVEPLPNVSYGDVKRVSVRDKNPLKTASLNSSRFEAEKAMNQKKSFTPPSLRGAQSVRPIFTPPPVSEEEQDSLSVISSYPEAKHPLWFLARERERSKPPVPKKIPEKEPVVAVSDGGKMRAFFFFFGLVSVLSVIGVGAYMFLPEADVSVKLKVTTQKSDFEFDGSTKTIGYSEDARTLPIRLIEKDQDVSLSFDATGKASLADQKARGSVIISNQYNSDPQNLVASTRIVSQDGKTFRLLGGVTVPGMTTINGKTEPGTIEATVIADQSGSEYNIGPSDFSIPGFQGTPKYAKFSAKSSTAMSGGGMSGNDVSAVSDQDVALAKKTVETKMKEVAFDAANQDLESGEKILVESVDTTLVSGSASPQSGAVTDTFEYHAKVHVRAYAFSEDKLKEMIRSVFEKQGKSKGIFSSPSVIDLQYGEPTADFVAGTLRISVHAVGRSESNLDEAQLSSDLAGKKESDLNGLLQKYPQIDTISISLWPEYIANRVPLRSDRIRITVESLDAK